MSAFLNALREEGTKEDCLKQIERLLDERDELAARVKAADVPITCMNDRGIQDYGDPVKCLYGGEVSVRDSSSAEHVACWLRIDDSSWCSRMDDQGVRLGPKNKQDNSSAHIDVDRAKAIVARLQAWINSAERDETPFGGLVERS